MAIPYQAQVNPYQRNLQQQPNQQEQKQQPQWKGKIGVSAWENKDNNGNTYLTVDVGGLRFALFRNTPQ